MRTVSFTNLFNEIAAAKFANGTTITDSDRLVIAGYMEDAVRDAYGYFWPKLTRTEERRTDSGVIRNAPVTYLVMNLSEADLQTLRTPVHIPIPKKIRYKEKVVVASSSGEVNFFTCHGSGDGVQLAIEADVFGAGATGVHCVFDGGGSSSSVGWDISVPDNGDEIDVEFSWDGGADLPTLKIGGVVQPLHVSAGWTNATIPWNGLGRGYVGIGFFSSVGNLSGGRVASCSMDGVFEYNPREALSKGLPESVTDLSGNGNDGVIGTSDGSNVDLSVFWMELVDRSKNLFDRVEMVGLSDPRKGKSINIPYRVIPEGIQVAASRAKVWMRFLMYPPQLSSEAYVPGVSYVKGSIVLDATDGVCYLALVDNVDKLPSANDTVWEAQLIPEFLKKYIRLKAQHRMLSEDDGKWTAERDAELELDRLLFAEFDAQNQMTVASVRC